jgi:hypothetical protein
LQRYGPLAASGDDHAVRAGSFECPQLIERIGHTRDGTGLILVGNEKVDQRQKRLQLRDPLQGLRGHYVDHGNDFHQRAVLEQAGEVLQVDTRKPEQAA